MIRYICTFDTSGIQRYVFGSSILRDNIGASSLVRQALRERLDEALEFVTGAGWTDPGYEGFLKGTGAATIIVNTGGNGQVLCWDEAQADALVAALSRLMIERAPGLRLVASVYPWESGSFADANDKARLALARIKTEAPETSVPSLPGAIETCQVTGWPAAYRVTRPGGGELQSVSAGIQARRKALNKAAADLEVMATYLNDEAGEEGFLQLLEQCAEKNYVFSHNIDEMRGRKGHKSYIGVIHIDANGMGQAFRRILHQHDDDPSRIAALQRASKGADLAAIGAFFAGLKWVEQEIERGNKKAPADPYFRGQIPLHKDDEGRYVFPVRPILVAGDDLTLVCEGSISFELAVVITRAFVKRLEKLGEFGKPGACVGISLGLAHSPFWRLYRLAEDRCRDAKRISRKKGGLSYLCWSRLELQETARERGGPYALHGEEDAWDQLLEEIWEPIQRYATHHRSQIKQLADDIRSGAEAVEQRKARWKERGLNKMQEKIFDYAERKWGGRIELQGCGAHYLDALDLLDFLVEKDGSKQKEEREA